MLTKKWNVGKRVHTSEQSQPMATTSTNATTSDFDEKTLVNFD